MPTYTIELTDGRKIKLEAADENQALETADLYEKGGEKAVEARYGDMSYGDAAMLRGLTGFTASLAIPAAAGLDYVKGRFTGDDRSYSEQLAEKRALVDRARETAGTGYEVAGGVASALIPGLGGASGLVKGGTGFANMAARTGLGAAEGAAYGGIQAASEGDDIGANALMGGAFGAGGSLVAQGARKVLSPAQQKLAGRVKRQVGVLEDAGVSVPASTQNQSKSLAAIEQQASKTLLSGGRDVVEQSRDDFTRAVASKLDDSARTADEIGPEFWDRVGDKFDQGYDNLRRNGAVVVPGQVSQELDRIKADIGWMGLTSGQERKVFDEIDRLKGFGVLDGRAYQETHQRLSKLIRDNKGGSEMRSVLIDIQSALADGFRANDQALADQVADMQRKYRLYKMIEPAVNAETGRISPQKLANTVKRAEGPRRYLRGKGPLTPLAEAGSALIREPGSSNTAENIANYSVGGGITGSIGASLATGNPLPAAAMAGLLGTRAAGDAYSTSPLGQRHLKADWLSDPVKRMAADRVGQAGARGGLNLLTPEQRRLLGR